MENKQESAENTTESTISYASDIKNQTSEKLKASGPTVQESVVNALVEVELESRKNLILSGLEKHKEAEKAFKSFKPDQEFNTEGKVEREFYTQSRLTEFNKLKKNFTDWNDAINSALKDNNYDKLKNLINVNKPKEEKK